MSIVLPLSLSEWEIISNKVDENEPLNPLERFIYENLPSGDDEKLFYIQLRNAIEYVVESAIKSPNSESAPLDVSNCELCGLREKNKCSIHCEYFID